MTPDDDDETQNLSQQELDVIVQRVVGTLTVTALQCRTRLMEDHGLTDKDAAVIVSQLMEFASSNMVDALNQTYPGWEPVLEKTTKRNTH